MNCKHFWDIETNTGQQSKGICRLCGEERMFFNSKEAKDKGYVPDSLKTGRIKRPRGKVEA